ncbi:class I SAM-dependent methyltransferase [Oceaniglobus indicus]|uniref:class I SAM-dependent methyltransferase n=1 Tax=Oceaniglobus indicus TaxID=2047749 RepID=UPI000C180F78|nr:class I SAM-dependent methyltransferase [Oceaniglobus indicus]
MPDDTDPSAFWNRVARRYETMAIRNPAAYEATLERVRAHLRPEARVLELGCGTGSTALRLAPGVRHYTGIDTSAEMIEIAREKQADAGIAGLEFQHASLGDAAPSPEPLDVVLAFNVLHLVPERAAAFAEIRQRLRPGGMFISKTPCLGGSYRVLQPVVAALRLFGKAPKLAYLRPAALQRDIAAAGFEIVAHGDYPRRPPSRFIVARKPGAEAGDALPPG